MKIIFSGRFFFSISRGQVRLPKFIGNWMILPECRYVNIWGWAPKEEPIFINFKGKKYETSADEHGNWSVTLSELEAGGPYSVQITAVNLMREKKEVDLDPSDIDSSITIDVQANSITTIVLNL